MWGGPRHDECPFHGAWAFVWPVGTTPLLRKYNLIGFGKGMKRQEHRTEILPGCVKKLDCAWEESLRISIVNDQECDAHNQGRDLEADTGSRRNCAFELSRTKIFTE